MIISGKEALDLDLKESSASAGADSFFNPSDIPAGGNVKMVFLGGIDGIVSWLQHNWWQVDRYGNNPGGYEVTRNVIFQSLKDSWTAPDECDPGFIMGSNGQQRYGATVLVDTGSGVQEKIFFFTKSIWNGLVLVYRGMQADFGDETDINEHWLRITNSGDGPNRYSVQFTGIPYKPAKGFTPKYNVRDFIKSHSFNDVVIMMREAGLPIDEKLAERGLDEHGNKLEKVAE